MTKKSEAIEGIIIEFSRKVVARKVRGFVTGIGISLKNLNEQPTFIETYKIAKFNHLTMKNIVGKWRSYRSFFKRAG